MPSIRPMTVLNNTYRGFISPSDDTPGIVDKMEAAALRQKATEVTTKKILCIPFPRPARARDLVRDFVDSKPQDSFSTEALAEMRSFIGASGDTSDPVEKKEWKSTHKTAHYHWWPMRETSVGADDSRNNLFAPSGGLGKYDRLFGAKSVEYQKENYFRVNNSDSDDAGWAGFCDRATALACLYELPQSDVTVVTDNGSETLSARDVQALMIVAQDRAVNATEFSFYGKRNNGADGDDVNEPYPDRLVEIFSEIMAVDAAFAMDIEKGKAVWNYAFDSIDISRQVAAPESVDVSSVPSGGVTEYLHFDVRSTGFSEENQDLWGWVNISSDGDKTQGWLSDWHPDFLWRQQKCDGEWSGKSGLNPEIDAQKVYAIYQKSLTGGTVDFT